MDNFRKIPTFEEYCIERNINNKHFDLKKEEETESIGNILDNRLSALENRISTIEKQMLKDNNDTNNNEVEILRRKLERAEEKGKQEVKRMSLITTDRCLKEMMKNHFVFELESDLFDEYKKHISNLEHKLHRMDNPYTKSIEELYTYISELYEIVDKAYMSLIIKVDPVDTEGMDEKEKIEALRKYTEKMKFESLADGEKGFILSIRSIISTCKYTFDGKFQE